MVRLFVSKKLDERCVGGRQNKRSLAVWTSLSLDVAKFSVSREYFVAACDTWWEKREASFGSTVYSWNNEQTRISPTV